MLTLDLFEDFKEPTLIDALRDFLPVALKELDLDHVPKIKLKKELKDTHVPTFGRFTNDEQVVYCVINNRHPNDVLRTLAHEMAHYAQGCRDELDADSWHTGSPIENQANAQAGVIMREFNKQFPKYMSLKPIVVENCDAKNAVPELKSALEKRKTELKNASAKVAYDKIDKIMTRIAQTYNLSGQELHDLWTERYGEIPDTWVLDEAQHTEIIRHPVGDWIVYLDNHSIMRAMTRGIGPRLASNLITVVAMIPDLENKVPIGGQFWIQDIKTNSSFYFKRLDVPGEPFAVRCETSVQDVPRASKQTPVFRVNAYTGPEKPEHIKAMKNAKYISRFVGGDTMAANIAHNVQKSPWDGDASKEIITNPTTQDSKRYDRAFTQAQQLKKKGEVEENFADGKGPGKPGDSQRHGIPKHATKAELEKASHSKGRKGQLARWQINMRNGKKK